MESLGTCQRRPQACLARHICQPTISFDRLALTVESEDLGTPGRGSDEPEQETDGGRLASPVRTEVTHDLAFGHLETEILDRVDIAVPLGKPLGSNGHRSHSRDLLVVPQLKLSKHTDGLPVADLAAAVGSAGSKASSSTLGAVIDLHLHSTCSDGSETPERVVELASEAGCTAMALTDHDGLAGVLQAGDRAASLGIAFVPGCEVSCSFEPGTMHALAYFVEPGEGPLQSELEKLRLNRIAPERAARAAPAGSRVAHHPSRKSRRQPGVLFIGRPHFAAVLVANGAAVNIQDAFDRLLSKRSAGYVPKARIDVASFIAAARQSGAVAVAPIPFHSDSSRPRSPGCSRELSSAGLGGMECYYGRYSPRSGPARDGQTPRTSSRQEARTSTAPSSRIFESALGPVTSTCRTGPLTSLPPASLIETRQRDSP